MWLQALAIVLPRVQQHYTGESSSDIYHPSPTQTAYAVADSYIGIFNSSMFAGMMFGAIGWGTCESLLLNFVNRIEPNERYRLGLDWSQRCVQCDIILYRSFWCDFCIFKLFRHALRYVILPRKRYRRKPFTLFLTDIIEAFYHRDLCQRTVHCY